MPGALAACLKVSHFATDCTKAREWPQLFLRPKKLKQSTCVLVNKPKTRRFVMVPTNKNVFKKTFCIATP